MSQADRTPTPPTPILKPAPAGTRDNARAILDIRDRIDDARRVAQQLAMMGAGIAAVPDEAADLIENVAHRLADMLSEIGEAVDALDTGAPPSEAEFLADLIKAPK